MKKKITDSFEDVFNELEKDLEFQQEVQKISPYYDLLMEIISRRNELGLTQKDLAERAETHQSRISRIEAGVYDVRLSTLIKIAKALESELEIKLIPYKTVRYEPVDEHYQGGSVLVSNLKCVQDFSASFENEGKFLPVHT